jgi:NTP pyrophosphatase (non-canonical NTP hydrolase)
VSLLDLACALAMNEASDDATPIARSAVDGLTEALGDDHPYTLAAFSVLSVLLAEAGELAEAERVETRSADRLAGTRGPQHPDTLRALANLLLTRQELGMADAEVERQQAISDLIAVIGADHPDSKVLSASGRLLRTLDPQPF